MSLQFGRPRAKTRRDLLQRRQTQRVEAVALVCLNNGQLSVSASTAPLLAVYAT
jgi:hypothetical protein